jgi:hypothetical protein
VENKLDLQNLTVRLVEACSGGEEKDGGIKYRNLTLKVPAAELSAYKLLFEELRRQAERSCAGNELVIPDHWQYLTGNYPQLVVTYREKTKSGKQLDSKWTLTIPHYSKPENFKPTLPSYTKGSVEGVLKFTATNARIVVNAISEAEARRVLNACKNLCDPEIVRAGFEVRIAKRFGRPLTETTVVPTRAAFFSKGRRDLAPDWRIKL